MNGPAAPAADLLDRVRQVLVASGRTGPPEAAAVAAALRQAAGPTGGVEVLSALRAFEGEAFGLGVLDPLVGAEGVSDVLVNAPGEVWVERFGVLERTQVGFGDDLAVRRLATRLAAAAGCRLDDAHPIADIPVAGGHRLHVALPVVTGGNTLLALRVVGSWAPSLEELARGGLADPLTAQTLRAALACRLSGVISGGTGSGKTTLLGALLGLLGASERVVVVEDTPELGLRCPHLVALRCRPANVEGAGAVGLRELVRACLRMRPDRIVVGEIRGAEVLDLLVALNTGHAGSWTTVHANRASEVPTRLAGLGALAGVPARVVAGHLAAGVELVVQLDRGGGATPAGGRRVSQVAVLRRGHRGRVRVVPALLAGSDGVRRGPGAAGLARLLDRRGAPGEVVAALLAPGVALGVAPAVAPGRPASGRPE